LFIEFLLLRFELDCAAECALLLKSNRPGTIPTSQMDVRDRGWKRIKQFGYSRDATKRKFEGLCRNPALCRAVPQAAED
jgi:hypothetical protein